MQFMPLITAEINQHHRKVAAPRPDVDYTTPCLLQARQFEADVIEYFLFKPGTIRVRESDFLILAQVAIASHIREGVEVERIPRDVWAIRLHFVSLTSAHWAA
jgi:hypothetical protein